jgi:hypothetical protein
VREDGQLFEPSAAAIGGLAGGGLSDEVRSHRREPKPSAYAFQRVAESGDLARLRSASATSV